MAPSVLKHQLRFSFGGIFFPCHIMWLCYKTCRSSRFKWRLTVVSFILVNLTSVEIASVQIEWSVRAGSVRNIDSARVSIPPTLKYDESKKWWVVMLLLTFHYIDRIIQNIMLFTSSYMHSKHLVTYPFVFSFMLD